MEVGHCKQLLKIGTAFREHDGLTGHSRPHGTVGGRVGGLDRELPALLVLGHHQHPTLALDTTVITVLFTSVFKRVIRGRPGHPPTALPWAVALEDLGGVQVLVSGERS
eukprot:CAMPEP_0172652906 /NCGR_PEP_ID=MMETSP1068-20121228/243559_1 /TAXON_ID=35684 /ORGANISM="Pseudopedinella elastica, Strain CCMP716" /LENGTH=108 /DNA_ID=CAMNT_0013467329 /DNA_START=195 /DNA_END=521 /DNA_ORIENTATION=+